MGRPALVPSRDVHEAACLLPRCRLRTCGRHSEGPRLGFGQEQTLPAESRCSLLQRSTGVGRRCAWRRPSLARREQCAFLRRPRRDQTPVVPSDSSASPTTFITFIIAVESVSRSRPIDSSDCQSFADASRNIRRCGNSQEFGGQVIGLSIPPRNTSRPLLRELPSLRQVQ